jgi:molybdopterin converting factor small subunit
MAMATVTFSGELQRFTDEQTTEVLATVYRDMMAELIDRYPRLAQSRFGELAVAIDGVIIVDPLLEPVPAHCEVFFLDFVAGG